jgi:hypothetical protein
MKRYRNHGVWCDPAGPAGAILPELRALRVDAEVVNAKEHGQACGLLYDVVEEGRLRHLGTPELVEALEGAEKRPLGDAWAWSRINSAVDISPLVAVTIAHWAAQKTKKRLGGTGVISLADALQKSRG